MPHRAAALRSFPPGGVRIGPGAAPGNAQDPLLWGSLQPGQHPVGYASRWALDSTRSYSTELAAPAYSGPRPVLVNVSFGERIRL